MTTATNGSTAPQAPVGDVHKSSDVLELSKWIDAVIAGQKDAAPIKVRYPELVEVGDALVVIATKVECLTCGYEHITSSHVLKRIPRKDGTVVYRNCPVEPDDGRLPHITEWWFTSEPVCWRCWDLAERLIDPTANLALAPDVVVEEVPKAVLLPGRDPFSNETSTQRGLT